MEESPIELHQFSHSHYNEKVRWTLDFKGLRHVRLNYLPGPHVPQIRRLTGQTQVPVLRMEGRTLHGSAAIVDAIEKRFPSPPLYPAEAAERDEALAIQTKLDAELGPEIRRAGFAAMLDDTGFMVRTFAGEKPAWKRSLYGAAFPAVRLLMKKSMNVTPETGRRAKERVDVLLDFIANRTASTGYFVGGAFTIADLTAAALVGPAILVDHPDMKQAADPPPALAALCEEWSRHPAMQWAQGIWRNHRPVSRGIVIR
jgi:glutathione S-transferase